MVAALAVALSLISAHAGHRAVADPPVPQVDVTELTSEPEGWDGQVISVVGELVGDYSSRPDGVWVQLNDDVYAARPMVEGGRPGSTNLGLGARVPSQVLAPVATWLAGRYGRLGPVVRLAGTFRHNDPTVTGETFLDVHGLEVLEPGRALTTPGLDAWTVVGLVLLAAAGLITGASRRRT